MISKSVTITREMIKSIDLKGNKILLNLSSVLSKEAKLDVVELLESLLKEKTDYFAPVEIIGLELNYKIDK